MDYPLYRYGIQIEIPIRLNLNINLNFLITNNQKVIILMKYYRLEIKF